MITSKPMEYCPFCGSYSLEVCSDSECDACWVLCKECGARGPKTETEIEAVVEWDNRYDIDEGEDNE